MKQFFKIMMDDYKAEGFSRSECIKYGIIAPVIYILITAII